MVRNVGSLVRSQHVNRRVLVMGASTCSPPLHSTSSHATPSMMPSVPVVTAAVASSPVLLPHVMHEWRFNPRGHCVASQEMTDGVGEDGITVRQCTRSHMTQQAQDHVRELMVKAYTLHKSEFVPQIPIILKHFFDAPAPENDSAASEETRSKSMDRQYVCALASNGALVGFATLTASGDEKLISSSAMFTDESLSEEAQKAVTRALFDASEGVMHDLALAIQADANSAIDVKNATYRFFRSTIGVSDFTKAYMREHGYSTEFHDHLEMTVFLDQHDWTNLSVLPNNITIEPLDIFAENLPQVYDVLNLAFGPSPPCFAAWKQHYAQHPRFAAELSFVAWDGDRVAGVCCLERIADGHGGGDDEVIEVYTTSANLMAAAKATEAEAAAILAVQLPDDYSECRAEIVAAATSAYVCSVATDPAFRGQGIAHALLRRCYAAAANAGLQTVTLGTDRENPRAVSVFERSGMQVTKTTNDDNGMSREVEIST